jgi:hypothetical protein
VQRIYLDQNKWIALARARTGHKQEAHLVEVLEVAQEAVRSGDASFPLSAQHYYETHLRGDPASRMDLARTMLDLSQHDAIAPPHVLVPYEIEVALIGQLQLPNDPPRVVQVFGKGANHAFHTKMFTYEAPSEYEGIHIPAELQAEATAVGSEVIELMTLAGLSPPETTRLKGERAQPADGLQVRQRPGRSAGSDSRNRTRPSGGRHDCHGDRRHS